MAEIAFDRTEYLKRIHLSDEPVAPTLESLQRLHKAQSFSVPFENLDILLGRGIKTDAESIYDKIVHRNRGGYCFELNGLLYQALKAFGFRVERLLARVWYGREDPGPKTHQVMVVTIAGREYLADVGFGGPGITEPVLIKHEQISHQNGDTFRISIQGGETILQKQTSSGWMNLYQLNRDPVLQVDILMSNFYTSCFPESRFRASPFVTIPIDGGRITIVTNELTIHKNGQTENQVIASSDYVATLEKYFGLTGDEKFAELTTVCEEN